MQMKNCSLRVIGLLLIGFLAVPLGVVYAQDPIIKFKSPAGEPRFVRPGDPIDPAIPVDVEVEFPIEETPCVGANPPVHQETLEVYLWQVIDDQMQQEWDITSDFTWIPGADPDRVEGTVTIGGTGSGQNRSRYGFRVCIENDVERKCRLGGFLRVEIPVTNFYSASYNTSRITGFGQTQGCCKPNGVCLIPSFAIPLINQYMQTVAFPIDVNMGTSTVTFGSLFYPLPLIGTVEFSTSLDTSPPETGGNTLLLGAVTIDGIDLSQLGMAGYNCVLGGSADGIVLGEVSPWMDLDGSMRIFDISVIGEPPACTLSTPSGECNINLVFDGN